jgi:hypothetical protein
MKNLFKHFDNNGPVYLIAGVVVFFFAGVAFYSLAGLGTYAHLAVR